MSKSCFRNKELWIQNTAHKGHCTFKIIYSDLKKALKVTSFTHLFIKKIINGGISV